MSLSAIGIVSSDIKKSCEFYKLLELDFKASFESEDHFEATTKSGVRLMLDSKKLMKKLNPKWEKHINSSITLCFKKDSPAEVDEVFKLIIKNGYKEVTKPWDAFWNQRYCSVSDPDGNQIDIFADL